MVDCRSLLFRERRTRDSSIFLGKYERECKMSSDEYHRENQHHQQQQQSQFEFQEYGELTDRCFLCLQQICG